MLLTCKPLISHATQPKGQSVTSGGGTNIGKLSINRKQGMEKCETRIFVVLA